MGVDGEEEEAGEEEIEEDGEEEGEGEERREEEVDMVIGRGGIERRGEGARRSFYRFACNDGGTIVEACLKSEAGRLTECES